jgi:hypothetical protein
MTDRLLALHNAHNRSLSLKISIGLHAFVRFFVFFPRLLELYLIDLNAVFLVCERCVEGKCVGWGDVTALRVLSEGPKFGASEGL